MQQQHQGVEVFQGDFGKVGDSVEPCRGVCDGGWQSMGEHSEGGKLGGEGQQLGQLVQGAVLLRRRGQVYLQVELLTLYMQ